jgi:hypothetical protein
MDTGESFPGNKTAGAWSWPLPSSTEAKNAWSYTFTPTYIFMSWRSVKHKDSWGK